MKLLSRLFRPAPAPTPPPTVEAPPPAPVAPPPPAVDPAEQEQLLRSIESGSLDAAELMRIAVEGQTTRLRQAAASAIDDPASWQDLLPRLRGRDKAAYKLIKQRLDAVVAQQRSVEQANSEAEALCVQIEKLATKAHDPLFEPTLSAYTSRWQALPPNFDAAIRTRGQQAIERCRERGCFLVQLTSNKQRLDAHRFYDRLGFEATHEGYKLRF